MPQVPKDPRPPSFNPGDYIKPTSQSRFEPEHWRYIVVQVGIKGMHALDLNNNLTLIEYPPYNDADFELATDTDEETLKDCLDAAKGRLDYRFEHWPSLA